MILSNRNTNEETRALKTIVQETEMGLEWMSSAQFTFHNINCSGKNKKQYAHKTIKTTNTNNEGLKSPLHCSVTQSCTTLCEPMDCSMTGFPILCYHLEFAQTHVYWVGDDIQPSHPLSPSSPPALNLSQHQGLFQWVGSSHHIGKIIGASASALPMNIQCWFPLRLTALIASLSKGLSRVFSSTTVWKHQFFSTEPSFWSNSHIHTWLLEKP